MREFFKIAFHIPARSLNHASIAPLVRAVAGQKLSLGLICCRFLPQSGKTLSSSFRVNIPEKYAPICNNYNFSTLFRWRFLVF